MNSIDKCFNSVRQILANLPNNWVDLTTHRLDIFDETQAKSQFLAQLAALELTGDYSAQTLDALPTAYDYIRLGHPLSSVLEWLLAAINGVPADQVITFTSKVMPILAILRFNAINKGQTVIYYDTASSPLLDIPRLEQVYGYQVQLLPIAAAAEIPAHDQATVIFVTQAAYQQPLTVNSHIDVTVNLHRHCGSAMVIHNTKIATIVKDVQHVRRRETIAMTPVNALLVLQEMVNGQTSPVEISPPEAVARINDCIKDNTGSPVTPLIGSSGLSIQYAILMGLVENAFTQYPGKAIYIMIPPNCYGGTNDQARRIADLIPSVHIIDLLVDGGQNLVASLDVGLQQVADADGVPIIVAEIPTNPRVEVPDMVELGRVLSAQRQTPANGAAVEPVFMVDQTFCPNVKLLDQHSVLATVKTISFSSGSKFPSGGRCIAGFCAANNVAKDELAIIAQHLTLSDNCAIAHQLNTLAENMPSMPARIQGAYVKTRQLVNHVQAVLPTAKINFVAPELAEQGFMPSVFSMDLPATGDSPQQRDDNKKILNLKLIEYMIEKHPTTCKYCVSYGQLKGSYWTIPATSTQGTTKETDKDYIVRVALSPECDVAALAESFSEFCRNENLI